MPRTSIGQLKLIRGVAYLNPYASKHSIKTVQRFVNRTARGRHRWGSLYRYPMIEFDDVRDLTALRSRFPRLIEAYKDLSDRPEQAENDS